MSEHDCNETKRKVHEYLQRELSEQDMQVVDAHLAHCEECEDEFDVQYALIQAIERAYIDESGGNAAAERVLRKLKGLEDA